MASEETEGHIRNVTGTPISGPAAIHTEDTAAESLHEQTFWARRAKGTKGESVSSA